MHVSSAGRTARPKPGLPSGRVRVHGAGGHYMHTLTLSLGLEYHIMDTPP